MLASKSDYFHSLNRKHSGLMYHPNGPEPTDPANSDPLYSPLRKTDSLREIAGTSRSFPKTNNPSLNVSSGDRDSLGTTLNISQIDCTDYNRFFDNFDKIFKVSESSSGGSPTAEQATQKKNICRVLMDDFELDNLNPSLDRMSDIFHPERSLNGFSTKERALPHLEHVPSQTYLGVKTEPSMSEMVPYKLTDYKEICKEPLSDKNRIEGLLKAGKEKLPDLKVPKALVNKLEGTSKGNEAKNNKGQENNTKLIGKVRVNIPAQPSTNVEPGQIKHKNSQQALEKIIKPKKYTNITRCKTFVLESIKNQGQAQNEERMRVNSLQGIDNGSKTTVAGQKNDFSLDLGPGSKSKFFLKGLEQRTTSNIQPTSIVNKTQNEVKNVRNNVTSRTYYSKENLSFLSNSSRDKAFEGQFQKNAQNATGMTGTNVEVTNQAPNGFQGQAVKMGVEEISKLYKDLRQSIKLNESQKPMQHIRINAKNLKPINDAHNESVPQR